MTELSSLEALASTLRLLRESGRRSGRREPLIGLDCLAAVIEYLRASGLGGDDLKPLIGLEEALHTRTKPPERRKGALPSDEMLARACAVLDLFIKLGKSEEQAAQSTVRMLLANRIQPPPQGGDARGWRRLLIWRNKLLQGCATPQALEEYKFFAEELENIPPGERVQRVLEEKLWDRRRASLESRPG